MTKLILLLFQLLLVLLLADLVAGAVHWLEDAYVREDTPIIGSFIGKANVIHHHLPRYLTRHNWWQSSWDLLAVSALVVFVAWRFQLLTWQVWWFAAVSANANEVHKWSHRTRAENGRLITWLQNLRGKGSPISVLYSSWYCLLMRCQFSFSLHYRCSRLFTCRARQAVGTLCMNLPQLSRAQI